MKYYQDSVENNFGPINFSANLNRYLGFLFAAYMSLPLEEYIENKLYMMKCADVAYAIM